MTDKEKRKNAPFYKNPGFYFTLLIVCALLTSVAVYSDKTKEQRAANPGVSTDIPAPEWTQPPALHTPSKTPSPTPQPESVAQKAVEKAAEKIKQIEYSLPSYGQINMPFDDKNLVYSEYFGDWRTHSATDFDGSKTPEVYAAAEGVVEKIYTDDKYGLTLVLSHPDGCTTYYSSLESTADIKKGDAVSRGEVIGTAGDSCAFEQKQGKHLHFWAERDGKAVNIF